MSPSRRSELHSLLTMAARADEKLGERVEQLQRSPGPAVLFSPGDDIALLREKFTAANQLLQHFDGLARWLGRETLLALELQKSAPEAVQLVRSVRAAAEKIREPVSSGDLLGPDYLLAREVLGEAYAVALAARTQLWGEAWAEVTTAGESAGNEEQITAVVVAMSASVELLGLYLIPLKYLRDGYARQLRGLQPERPPAQPLVVEPAHLLSSSAKDHVPPYLFTLVGEIWVIRYEAEEGLFNNDKGMQYIRRILENPNRPVPALDLVGGSRTDAAAARSIDELEKYENEEDCPAGESWDDVLDEEAEKSIERRVKDIADQLEQARAEGNKNKVAKLEGEWEGIENELRATQGWGGKRRRLGGMGAAEKARQAVCKALDRAYKKMVNAPAPLSRLVDHLRRAIRAEGNHYVYRPDDPPPDWIFSTTGQEVQRRADREVQCPGSG